MLEEICKKAAEFAVHTARICAVDITLLDCAEKVFSGTYSADGKKTFFCTHCTGNSCSALNTHLYGSSEACRWNGKYVYYCPMGLVFTAASLYSQTQTSDASLIAGPFVIGEMRDTLEELYDSDMKNEVEKLPVMDAGTVTSLSEILFAVGREVCSANNSFPRFDYNQEEILKAAGEAGKRSKTDGGFFYPYESEKQLQDLIGSQDKNGAKKLLNELLGCIYFGSDNISEFKSRVIELLVLLSRATIDAGADIREIFLYNTSYIERIGVLSSADEINVLLSEVMNGFIDSAFNFRNVKHSDTVFKVFQYVNAHYNEKISLDEIADYTYISPSYLSRLFKNETGMNVSEYVNSIRIKKSKMYLRDASVSLADISSLCGFEDQSYFTKVFKRAVGITPKSFRNSKNT